MRDPDSIISSCAICSKPLGQESKDLGFATCHEHRTCNTCNAPLSPAETSHLYYHEISAVQCARCLVLGDSSQHSQHIATEHVTITRAEYERLNLARLLATPNRDVSPDTNQYEATIQTDKWLEQATIEDAILFMRKMQASAAQASLIVSKFGRERISKANDDLKRNTQFDDATAQVRREKNKQIERAAQQSLSPAERSRRAKRDKGIQHFMTMGMSESEATKQYDRAVAIDKLMSGGKSRNEAQAIVDSPDYGRIQ